MAAKATLALKAGVLFRRDRLVIVSPAREPSWPLSGRNSTYRPVRICRASSTSVLGQNNTTATDLDTFHFPGNAGEKIKVVLDHGGSEGSTGTIATLQVLDQSGH